MEDYIEESEVTQPISDEVTITEVQPKVKKVIPQKDYFQEPITKETVTEEKKFTPEYFQDEPTGGDNESPELNLAEEGIVKGKNFILNFIEYIQSSKFFTRCEEVGNYKKVSTKTIAKNFLEKVLATIGDVLGIVIDSVQDVFTSVLSLLHKALLTSGHLICNLAKSIVRIVTLNKTLIA